jgi:hypothetical protein
MRSQPTLGLLFCLMGVADGVADSPVSFLVKQISCSIELSMRNAPNAYLVAVVQYPGKTQCDGSVCIETFSVVKVLASGGGHSTQPTSISLSVAYDNRDDTGGHSNGTTSIGVYIPARSGELYLLLSQTSPAIPDVVADYEQAIALAKTAPAGAPHCGKAF